MRFAAFFLVLAVALGAFLILRSPPGDSAGVSPAVGATPVSEGTRAPADLVRGETSNAVRSQVPPVAPPAIAAKPPTKASVAQTEQAAVPVAIDGLGAISAVDTSESDPVMNKKYGGSTPDERRQAIQAIRDLYANSTNIDPKLATALKQELEWLERSLDS